MKLYQLYHWVILTKVSFTNCFCEICNMIILTTMKFRNNKQQQVQLPVKSPVMRKKITEIIEKYIRVSCCCAYQQEV